MKEKIKNGFTLAEVLITLMIIGVVAVLTIPAMVTNINEQAMAKQRDITSKKFMEGLGQMRVDGVLNQKFTSTQDFVNEMKKYFKIVSTCDSEHLNSCFPAQTITGTYIDANDPSMNKEEVYDNINNLTLETISGKTGQKFDTYSNLMGVTLQDGLSLLLAVNTDCTGPSEGDTQSSLDSCIAYIADVNNAKTPNTEGKDIYANIFLVKQPVQIINNKIYEPNVDGSFECSEEGRACGQAAKAFCEKQGGRLPTKNELMDIAVAMGYNCRNGSGSKVICNVAENIKSYGPINSNSLYVGIGLWVSDSVFLYYGNDDVTLYTYMSDDGTTSAICVK